MCLVIYIENQTVFTFLPNIFFNYTEQKFRVKYWDVLTVPGQFPPKKIAPRLVLGFCLGLWLGLSLGLGAVFLEVNCPKPCTHRIARDRFQILLLLSREFDLNKFCFHWSHKKNIEFSWFPGIEVYINDTHREKLFYSIQYKKASWQLLTFLIRLHNQLSSIVHSIIRIKSTDVWKMWFIE